MFLLLWLLVCGVLGLEYSPRRYGFSEETCPDGFSPPERSLSGDIVWCKTDQECDSTRRCTPVPGMKHFGLQISYCCETRGTVCMLPPQPGYGECGQYPRPMFYFDSTALRCKEFEVIECLGTNENRFATIEECRARCESTACLPGEGPAFEGDAVQLCGDGKSCSPGYTCRFDSLFRRHVCCGFNDRESCAIGQKPYVTLLTGQAQRCVENPVVDECPPDYVCSVNARTNQRHCCALEGGSVCPAGQKPFVHPSTRRSVKCSPLAFAATTCPVGFSCIAAIDGSQWGFCCSDAVTALCPPGTQPFLGPQPVTCTIGVTKCSTGYACQNADPGAIIGFCCSQPMTSSPRPYKRLIDIQKEIDRVEIRRTDSKPRGSPVSRPKSSQAPPQPRPVEQKKSLRLLLSTDPLCRTLIADSTCSLESDTDCSSARGFFCQFNVQVQRFACCSLE